MVMAELVAEYWQDKSKQPADWRFDVYTRTRARARARACIDFPFFSLFFNYRSFLLILLQIDLIMNYTPPFHRNYCAATSRPDRGASVRL